MFHDIDLTTARKNDTLRWVDVRSPGEYAKGTIPGSVNVPLLNDEERDQVGTAYKQQGRHRAMDLAMDLVSPKIPQMVREITNQLHDGQAPLIFCWRGGMRSRAMCTFLDLWDRPVYRLQGGYRAYREFVVDQLAQTRLDIPAIVLHGMTGVGKTMILQKLQTLGEPVLDLEGLAGHRGSAFGSLSSVPPHSQKTFDALLWERLVELENKPYFFMEAESKRIGRVLVPDFIMRAKYERSVNLHVQAPLYLRIERILQTYLPEDISDSSFQEQVRGAIKRIEKRLSPDVRQMLYTAVDHYHYASVVRLLLTEYYDRRYRHSMSQYTGNFHTVDATHLDKAVRQCKDLARQTLAGETLLF